MREHFLIFFRPTLIDLNSERFVLKAINVGIYNNIIILLPAVPRILNKIL